MNTQEEKGVQITYLFFYQDEQPRTPGDRCLTARPRHQRIVVLRLAVAPKGRAPAPKQRPLALKRRADRRSARVLSTSLYFCWAEAQDGSIRGSYSALCSVSSDLQWMDGYARLQNAVERADCRGSGSATRRSSTPSPP